MSRKPQYNHVRVTLTPTHQAIFVPTSTASQAFGNRMIQAIAMWFNVRMVPTANQGENAEPAPIMEACNAPCIHIEGKTQQTGKNK